MATFRLGLVGVAPIALLLVLALRSPFVGGLFRLFRLFRLLGVFDLFGLLGLLGLSLLASVVVLGRAALAAAEVRERVRLGHARAPDVGIRVVVHAGVFQLDHVHHARRDRAHPARAAAAVERCCNHRRQGQLLAGRRRARRPALGRGRDCCNGDRGRGCR